MIHTYRVLQMHNGVGKTTTLYLLQCLFTNEEPDSTTYARCDTRTFEEARAGEPSEFSVDLKINNEHWIIGMKFQPREKTYSIYVVDPKAVKQTGTHCQTLPTRIWGNSKFVASFPLTHKSLEQEQKVYPKMLLIRPSRNHQFDCG